MAGIIAHVPGIKPQFIPVAADLFEGPIREVPDRLRILLAFTFGLCGFPTAALLEDELPRKEEEELEEDEDLAEEVGFRMLYKERDMDSIQSATEFVKALAAGRPCVVRVLFRLLGGKGGFGSLLRSQKGKGKKTTNLDAMRDLSGRRLRHSKAVDRIKDWLQKQKKLELAKQQQGQGPELPKPVKEAESLNPEFVKKLKRAAAERPSVVSQGMKRLDELAAAEALEALGGGGASSTDGAKDQESAKRARHLKGPAAKEADVDWLGALDALGALSSPDPDDEGEEAEGAGGSKGSS